MSTVRKQIVVDFISQTKASELHGFYHKVSTEILKDFKHNIDIISFAFYRNHSGTLWKLGIFFLIIEVQLIDNVVLVSGVQQSEIYIYIHTHIYTHTDIHTYTHTYMHTYTHTHTYNFFFRFFSLIGQYKILSIVSCAIRQVLVGYLPYVQLCVYVNPILIYPSPPSPFPLGNHKRVFYVCGSISVLNMFIYIICFLDSTYKQYYLIFIFLCLTSFSIILSRSIHVAANSIILFFFMAE